MAGVERYVIRGGRPGYERLELLARACWPDTSALFDRVGIRQGTRCIDLGCGGGQVTFEITRLVGPAGHVLGVDMDDVKLSLARAAAAGRGLTNVEFRIANANDWNEPGTYDFVYCRFLLEHLRQPVDLLKRMWSAVRPGGAIAVEDADFGSLVCYPPNDGYEFFSSMYPRAVRLHGGDATVGRKLYHYFLQVGIPNPRLELIQRAYTTGEEKSLMLSTLKETADAIIAAKLASENEVSSAIANLAAFTDDPATIIAHPRIFQLWSRRPLGN